MNEVALIIIYNHRYDKNIEKLEKIYFNRFNFIYHLVPFYTGNKSNVIPVYGSSLYFQGYVAQGFNAFFDEKFNNYFFIGDDLLLNPAINEKNYIEHLGLRKNSCFIPGFINIHEANFTWHRVGEAYNYDINGHGAEVKNEIPDYATALQAFTRKGLQIKPLQFDQVFNKLPQPKLYKIKKWVDYFTWKLRRSKHRNTEYNLSYPLVGSYSDIFIISSNTIKLFCHYCGVFAATNLFAELALPTALVLCADNIIVEKDLKLQGQPLWTTEDFKILEKYNNQLNFLLEDFPTNHLYIHPVKLSKWNAE